MTLHINAGIALEEASVLDLLYPSHVQQQAMMQIVLRTIVLVARVVVPC